jgi:hypothetical protein
VCGFAIAALMLILLALYYYWNNKRRDSEGHSPGILAVDGEEIMDDDLTDKEHRGFRYML